MKCILFCDVSTIGINTSNEQFEKLLKKHSIALFPIAKNVWAVHLPPFLLSTSYAEENPVGYGLGSYENFMYNVFDELGCEINQRGNWFIFVLNGREEDIASYQAEFSNDIETFLN